MTPEEAKGAEKAFMACLRRFDVILETVQLLQTEVLEKIAESEKESCGFSSVADELSKMASRLEGLRVKTRLMRDQVREDWHDANNASFDETPNF